MLKENFYFLLNNEFNDETIPFQLTNFIFISNENHLLDQLNDIQRRREA